MTEKDHALELAQTLGPILSNALGAIIDLVEAEVGEKVDACLLISAAGDTQKMLVLSTSVTQEVADAWAEKIKQQPALAKELTNATLN